MIRNFIISLSILFFALSSIIIFKILIIPTNNTPYQNDPKELDLKNLSSKSANISEHNYEERVTDEALIKELQDKIAMLEKKLSDTNMEIQANVETKSEGLFLYSRPNDKDKLNQKMDVDSQQASQLIYTIQIGSHTNKTDADEEFKSILQTLNKKEHDYLRIEKIGKFYTVRLGKFDDYDNTDKFLEAIKPPLSTAVILKAYIKNERIIKLYRKPKKQLTF